ncbi:Bardet-Biedl syndrome 5 [Nymphon striatum]|nr:Bardet-Biedl syndrome 5 [Nymphon striatum]
MAYTTEPRTNNELFWQDKEIRFNLANNATKTCPGEKIMNRLEHIEDSKAGRDKIGRLYITNLRMIWHSYSKQSVGLCKYFFNQMDLAYKASRLYREVKLRSAIMVSKQLRVLPLEKIYSKINGVWNLSNDQGNLGTFYITNIRIVWHANLNENYNISLPYIQILTVRVRDSKFGPALVIETSETSGSYTLGFRIDPQERLQQVLKEISSCHQAHSAEPIFGVEVNFKKQDFQVKQEIERVQEDVVIEEKDSDLLAAYLADDHQQSDREVIYSDELGLAVEKLKEGYTLANLWQVIPS